VCAVLAEGSFCGARSGNGSQFWCRTKLGTERTVNINAAYNCETWVPAGDGIFYLQGFSSVYRFDANAMQSSEVQQGAIIGRGTDASSHSLITVFNSTRPRVYLATPAALQELPFPDLSRFGQTIAETRFLGHSTGLFFSVKGVTAGWGTGRVAPVP
jgi:hypothetical protein